MENLSNNTLSLSLEDLKFNIGRMTRKCRGKLGWSQNKLCAKADCDKTTIQNIEKGSYNISITLLYNITIALGINTVDFLFEVFTMPKYEEWEDHDRTVLTMKRYFDELSKKP